MPRQSQSLAYKKQLFWLLTLTEPLWDQRIPLIFWPCHPSSPAPVCGSQCPGGRWHRTLHLWHSPGEGGEGNGGKEGRGGIGRRCDKKMLNFHELYCSLGSANIQHLWHHYESSHHSTHHYLWNHFENHPITLTSSCTIVTSIWLHHHCDITANFDIQLINRLTTESIFLKVTLSLWFP